MSDINRFRWGCVHASIILIGACAAIKIPALSAAIVAATGALCGALPTPFTPGDV
jgi:hypothetical protein